MSLPLQICIISLIILAWVFSSIKYCMMANDSRHSIVGDKHFDAFILITIGIAAISGIWAV